MPVKMPFVILLAVAHSEVLEVCSHVILTSAQCESFSTGAHI